MKIKFYIVPQSSENKLCGYHGDAIKLKIKAPPVDGKANKAIIIFLAEFLNIPKKYIDIKHGDTGRNKLVEFNVDKSQENEILEKLKSDSV